jgi:hypothetical protein
MVCSDLAETAMGLYCFGRFKETRPTMSIPEGTFLIAFYNSIPMEYAVDPSHTPCKLILIEKDEQPGQRREHPEMYQADF